MAEDVLKLALPVMLHKEKEVAAYKEAKPRIETYMNEEVQIPTEVGMFCYMLPFAIRKPENRKTQLEVQKKERFSIYHVQAPVTGVHSLDLYGQSAIEANDMGSLLETAVEHTAQLAEYSKTRPEFDVHQGIYLTATIDGDKPFFPGTYPLDLFMKQKDEVFDRTVNGFIDIESFASNYGLNVILENEMMATFQPKLIEPRSKAHLFFSPFAYLDAMAQISKNQTFDTAHFASRRSIESIFSRNDVEQEKFFELFGLSNWDDFDRRHGNMHDYFHDNVRALHISNTEGIGLHLEDPQEIEAWGGDGTNEGLLTKQELRQIFLYAKKRGIPAALEVNYDIPQIPVNKFKEADDFLKYVFDVQE